MINNNGVHGLPIGYGGGIVNLQNQQPPQPKKRQKDPWDGNVSVFYEGDSGGCCWWRQKMPQLVINYSKLGNVLCMNKLIPDPNFYTDVKSVRLQRQATPEHAEFMRHLRDIADKNGMKLIYEIDDVIFKDDIPKFNVARDAYNSEAILKSTIDMIGMCDTMSVTCDYLKGYFEDTVQHKDIRVIPNMASKMWFDGLYDRTKIMTSFEKNKKKPRVLYAGSGNHFNIKQVKDAPDDFSHVIDAVIKTQRQYQWVFMGAYPRELKPLIDSGVIEFHKWEMILNYPKKIHALDINAVVAPLIDCPFNRSKSNIKFLESGYLGIPGVFQDMITYKDAPIRFKTGDEMLDQLHKLLNDRQYYAKMSKRSRDYANRMWLEDNINQYTDLIF